MDECQVAQRLGEQNILSAVSYFLCHQFPSLLTEWHQQQDWRGWHDCSTLKKGHSREEEKSWEAKGVKMKQVSWTNLPTSPKGLKAACSICMFLVYHFTRIWDTTKAYTQQSVCRTVFFHLPWSSKFP